MALPKYFVPKDLESAIKKIENARSARGFDQENKFSLVLQILMNIDCLEIAECHYLQFLKLGLYLEQYQRRQDMMKQFQLQETAIEKVSDSENKFKIYIKNLDEDDPILNVSDYLIAYEQNKPNTNIFFTVVKVCKGHVIVAATKKFCKTYNESTKYRIKLKFNTYWFQCCHYSLTAVNSFSHYIFPKKKPVTSEALNCPQIWFNIHVFNNLKQKQAVLNIVNKSAFPAPYILYGPPGTGKTSTLVEAICQSWKQSDAYILICAPSNAACDVVTKRLLDYIPSYILYRIYSRTEEYSRIDEDIKKCCNFNNGKVDEIEKVDLSLKKIIITTLCTSLRLEKLKLPFSYLFIDEGGQALLPEIFLPLCALKSSSSFQIVMSGDPKQLGPLIRSKLAEPILGQSILEKLMKHDPYKKDPKTGYDPHYITKLIRNYRSNDDIIYVSNVLFYENELITCINNQLDFFSVVFWAIEGKELKSTNSPSLYNEEEINVVLSMTENFIGKIVGNKIIRKKDIGIVTPFKLQASKIQERLNNSGLEEVNVGTVEVYQGQEKEVIIISTVRNRTFTHNGVKHIGFLSNPKRFNVALTRAKSLLVVVGNPTILQTDKYWRYFLKFCKDNDACEGDPFILTDETSCSLQELNTGSKSKQSTDLFRKAFKILEIDDGVKNKNIKSTDSNSWKTDTPNKSMGNANSDITNIPMISTNSVSNNAKISVFKSPMSNINEIPNSAIPISRTNSSIRNLHSIRNSSVSTLRTTNTSINSINSVPNAIVTRSGLSAPMSNINEIPNSATLISRTNSSTRNLHSIRDSSVSTLRTTNTSIYSINSVPNATVTRSGLSASMSSINEIPNSTNNKGKPIKVKRKKGCCCIL